MQLAYDWQLILLTPPPPNPCCVKAGVYYAHAIMCYYAIPEFFMFLCNSCYYAQIMLILLHLPSCVRFCATRRLRDSSDLIGALNTCSKLTDVGWLDSLEDTPASLPLSPRSSMSSSSLLLLELRVDSTFIS